MLYFYDEQIRRYILQFIRLFSEFSVKMGKDDAGNDLFQKIPVRYGDSSRMASHVMKQNSENMMNVVPMLSVYITDLAFTPERRQYPQHVEKVEVYEKAFDDTTSTYKEEVGDTYTIERYMPVPYNLTFNVDVWSSNTDQKLQIIEQLLVLFNPSVNIMTSDNEFDWSALTYTEMTNVNWSIRQVPVGVDDIIDVATVQFLTPIWLNPPAKVHRQTIIHTIISKLQEMSDAELDSFRDGNLVPGAPTQYVITTHTNNQVKFLNNEATLLYPTGAETNDAGDILSWKSYLDDFGLTRPGISQIRFKRDADPSNVLNDVIGTIEFHPTIINKLTITLDTDTLPGSTLSPVNAIIDPTTSGPGTNLPAAATGQRYLILDHVPGGGAWGTAAGNTNDIIEFNGSAWVVSFDSSVTSTTQYILNSTTSKQYEWTGTEWIDSYEGIYRGGFWRIYL